MKYHYMCFILLEKFNDILKTAVRPTAVVDAVDQKLTIDQGTTATIRCSVTGEPQPTVTWSKSRGELTERHRVSHTASEVTSIIYIFSHKILG